MDTPFEVANEHEDSNSNVRWFVNEHPIISGRGEVGTNDPANVA
jgi:hypothetical protein